MKHLKWVEDAIRANPRDASARASLLNMLKEAGQTDKLEQAREEFAAVMPLPAALWLEWLEELHARLRHEAASPDGSVGDLARRFVELAGR